MDESTQESKELIEIYTRIQGADWKCFPELSLEPHSLHPFKPASAAQQHKNFHWVFQA